MDPACEVLCEGDPVCLVEFGQCLFCGRQDGLPWGPMLHEYYGPWAMREAAQPIPQVIIYPHNETAYQEE